MIILTYLRRRSDQRRWSARPDFGRFLWRRSRALLLFVPVALVGCQTLMHPADTSSGGAGATQGATSAPGQDASAAETADGRKPNVKVNPGLDRARFPSKLTQDQQFSAHMELGKFQESQENFDLALAEYVKALESCESAPGLLSVARNPTKQALAHRRMGTALDCLGRFEQSENEYKTALKLSPNDPKIWNDAGYSFYMQGRWADAERALKTAAQLDPNNTKIMINLGLNLAASGRSDEALAQFTKAGGRAAGHANLAYILAGLGKTAEAEKHYKLALEIQPQLEPAKAALVALGARTAYEAKIAAARTQPTAKPTLLMDQPGVLPVAALRQPPPVETVVAARPRPTPAPAPAPTSVAQTRPNGPPKPATSPTQAASFTRVAPKVPVDPALSRATAPVQRRVPPATPPRPVPPPMPMPGPVPPFVPPASS